METPWRPTRAQLVAARGKGIRDVIAPRLDVLFCGINPGLYTAAVGHHFARPGNRFWTALHGAGFTAELVSPFGERTLLDGGLGITNLVNHATAAAEELAIEDLREGAAKLEAKVRRYRPKAVVLLGMGAYRAAFGRPRARIGLQPETIGRARLWILPNPSGRTAGYPLAAMIDALREVRRAARRRAGTKRRTRL